MGCFSFICKECGEGINSTSLEGEVVRLFLLKDGKVLQEMEGEYDSYGRVFRKRPFKGKLRDSIKWKDPLPTKIPSDPCEALMWLTEDKDWKAWGNVCDLIELGRGSYNPHTNQWENRQLGNGIAAVHSACFREIPTTCSESDPDQGWNPIKDRHRGVKAQV